MIFANKKFAFWMILLLKNSQFFANFYKLLTKKYANSTNYQFLVKPVLYASRLALIPGQTRAKSVRRSLRQWSETVYAFVPKMAARIACRVTVDMYKNDAKPQVTYPGAMCIVYYRHKLPYIFYGRNFRLESFKKAEFSRYVIKPTNIFQKWFLRTSVCQRSYLENLNINILRIWYITDEKFPGKYSFKKRKKNF